MAVANNLRTLKMVPVIVEDRNRIGERAKCGAQKEMRGYNIREDYYQVEKSDCPQ